MNILLDVNLMRMIILKPRPKCFSEIYWNLYVQGERKSHRVQKDNHIIKPGYQGKEVVNKVQYMEFGLTT
jgi:hypothetical protein